MSDEIHRLNTYLNVHEMFPRAAKIVEILGWLKYYWPDIVGRGVAAYSRPYKLGFEELCVYVSKPSAKNQLMKMKGNILRVMCNRFGYEKGEKFELSLTDQVPVQIIPFDKSSRRVPHKIEVSEEEVSKYMEGAPETLPEDINYALSHFRAFLESMNGH